MGWKLEFGSKPGSPPWQEKVGRTRHCKAAFRSRKPWSGRHQMSNEKAKRTNGLYVCMKMILPYKGMSKMGCSPSEATVWMFRRVHLLQIDGRKQLKSFGKPHNQVQVSGRCEIGCQAAGCSRWFVGCNHIVESHWPQK